MLSRTHSLGSVFRTAKTEFALRAKNIAVKIGDPLSSARRNIEVADRALDMRRYASPIELGVEISKVGRRAVAELFIHSDFFEFAEKSIGLAKIMWVAELADQICRANKFSLVAIDIPGAWRRRKARELA